MSDDIKDQGDVAPDPIKNLKGEFNRKLDGTQQTLQALARQQEEMMKALGSLTETIKPAQARTVQADTEDLETLYYKDPVGYAKAIEERAEKRIMGKLAEVNQTQGRVQQILGSLTSEFPELNDQNSELYRKAVENYQKLDKEDQKNPIAYKTAVLDAAMEMGVKPRSKRPDSDEDFVGSSYGQAPRRQRKSDKLDPVTEQWAEILGVPLDDATKSRLKQRSERKWNRYEAPAPTKGSKK